MVSADMGDSGGQSRPAAQRALACRKQDAGGSHPDTVSSEEFKTLGYGSQGWRASRYRGRRLPPQLVRVFCRITAQAVDGSSLVFLSVGL
jgi:hypothetical protein